VAAGIVLSAGAYLTGSVVGTLSDAPWTLPYFGELRHPVALYQAFGLWVLFVLLWLGADRDHPRQTVLLAGLGYSLLRLLTDTFMDKAALIGGFRISQVIALSAALTFSLLLAQQNTPSTRSSVSIAPNEPPQ
jgi:prolipoprotein diacylglyceryltransferase